MNAREFVEQMEEIINNPNQRLVGDMTTGYKLLDTDEIKERNILSSAIKSILNSHYGYLPKKEQQITFFMPDIKKVIFNDPCTIVLWRDGTKTIVRCGEDDIFDPEKGLAMAISKKALGNKRNYYEVFKEWLPKEKERDILDELSEALSDMMEDMIEKWLTKGE